VILVCAATGTEAAACRRGIADAGASGFGVLTTGVGPERAAEALTRWLRDAGAARSRSRRPALVVSSGFAGALSAGIEPLTWVTASSLYRLTGGRAFSVTCPGGLLRVAEHATVCGVISSGEVLADGIPGLPHPAAVDMESAGLAAAAGAAGIPFAVLRLVTDTPGRPMAPLGRSLAAAFAAPGAASLAARGARAALEIARSPVDAVAFVRESIGWRDRLRDGWREHARRGVPCSTAGSG
jgi:nucleoside phosphorylase